MNRVIARLLAAAVVSIMPPMIAAQDLGVDPCPREPGRVYGEKGIVLDVTNDPPCQVVFRATGVRLTGIAGGERPDPGRSVIKDARGRYYSTDAIGWGPTITVWSADGAYLSSFGRRGDGPGEFANDHLSLFVDSGDSLHVRDVANWSVFTPDHEYVRRAPSRMMGLGNRETTALYYDGRILVSDGSQATSDTYFRLVNRDGSLDNVFGTAEKEGRVGGYPGHPRPIAYLAGNRSFWVGPSAQGSNQLAVVEWDILGSESIPGDARRPEPVQTLRRHLPWFEWTGHRHTSPMVRSLHITEEGLLYVQMWRPSGEYLEAVKPFERRLAQGRWTLELEAEIEALAESLTHIVVEVIDVRSARLLASAEYSVGEVLQGNPLIPHGLFRNEMAGYVYFTDQDGLPYVEIIEVGLEKK